MKDYDADEPKLWVTVLKLILIATVLIGGTGLALWWASQKQETATRDPATAQKPDWGVVSDSPLRRAR